MLRSHWLCRPRRGSLWSAVSSVEGAGGRQRRVAPSCCVSPPPQLARCLDSAPRPRNTAGKVPLVHKQHDNSNSHERTSEIRRHIIGRPHITQIPCRPSHGKSLHTSSLHTEELHKHRLWHLTHGPLPTSTGSACPQLTYTYCFDDTPCRADTLTPRNPGRCPPPLPNT